MRNHHRHDRQGSILGAVDGVLREFPWNRVAMVGMQPRLIREQDGETGRELLDGLAAVGGSGNDVFDFMNELGNDLR
jgi:hypothetical protein